MTISGRATLAGIVGDPVAHSLSPRLHAHWLNAHKIDGAYVPLRVRADQFSVVLRGLRAAGFAGINVTVPHKEAAFAVADRLDDAAVSASAANLLIFHGDHIEGRNTDVRGLVCSLEEKLGKDGLRAKIVAIAGSGGAARAAVLAANELGAAEVRIVARNVSRAETLARDLSARIKTRLKTFALSDWKQASAQIDLFVNATSAGMKGMPALSVSLDVLPKKAAVCDIVYNPLDTPLLVDARARGNVVIDGLGMLMHQAVPSFEAFYGIAPQVTPALRRELEEALHGNL